MFSPILPLIVFLMSTSIRLSYQSKQYSVSFKNNILNILVEEEKTVNLYLDPSLKINDSNVEIKFECQNADDTKRLDWNSTDNHCTIVDLLSGYDYEFNDKNSSSISLLIKGLKPGKTQLVGNTRDNKDIE